MASGDFLLIAVCGVLGFGIIWHIMGSRGKD